MKERFKEKILVLLIVIWSICWMRHLVYKPVTPEGEVMNYILPTVSMEYRSTFCMNEEDVRLAKRDYPQFGNLIESQFSSPSLSSFMDEKGDRPSGYFPTYAILCMPIKLFLQMIGRDQSYTVVILNVLFYCFGLIVVAVSIRLPFIKKLLLLLLLAIHPILITMDLASAEVLIFSLAIAALSFHAAGRYSLAALSISLAGTMQPTIMVIGMGMIADRVYQWYKEQSDIQNVNSYFSLIRYLSCYIISLVPFFYDFIYFGVMNLIAAQVPMDWENYWGRYWAYLFDLNLGLLPYYPFMLLFYFMILPLKIKEGNRVYLVSLFMLLATIAAVSIMIHINCGMSGIHRYNLWISPIVIFAVFLSTYPSRWLNRLFLFLAGISVLYIILYLPVIWRSHYLYMLPAAQTVLEYFPSLYNPLPSTFISRTEHRDGGYLYYRPAFWTDNAGYVRKILFQNESADEILRYCVCDGQERVNLAERIAACENDGERFHYLELDKGKVLLQIWSYDTAWDSSEGKNWYTECIIPRRWEERIKGFSLIGFDGIYLSHLNHLMPPQQRELIEREISRVLSVQPEIDVNKGTSYFSMKEFNQSYLAVYSEEEREEIRAKLLSFSPIPEVKYMNGISPVEKSASTYWQWMDKEAIVEVYNSGEAYEKSAVVNIVAPGTAKADLTIRVNEKSYVYEVYSKSTEIVVPVYMNHGKNTISLCTNAARVQAPNDPRSLYMCLVDSGFDAFLPESPWAVLK